MNELNTTIFYIRNSGNIFSLWSGTVDFSVFKEDAQDYASIMGYIVVEPLNLPNDLNKVKVVNGELVNK